MDSDPLTLPPRPVAQQTPSAASPSTTQPANVLILTGEGVHKIASIDLAAAILAGEDFPRQERKQIDLLTRTTSDKSSRMVSIRAMYLELERIRDDSILDALHTLLEPVLDVMEPQNVHCDEDVSEDHVVFEHLRLLFQEGAAKQLYSDYPEIGKWIEGCVNRLCGKLHLHDNLKPATGLDLFKALVHLRVAYGELLGGLTPLFEDKPKKGQMSVSAANLIIPEIRHSMMAATIRRFQQDPNLQPAIPDLYRIIESGKAFRDCPKISARSDLDELRRIFGNIFDGSTWQLYSPMRALHDFDIFCKLAVPYLDKCGSNSLEEAAYPNSEWFLPGQIAVIKVAESDNARTICTSFDSHIDVTSVAVALDPLNEDKTASDYHRPLGGVGLQDDLQFELEGSVSMSMGPTGKLYGTHANRFLKDDGGKQSTALHASVKKFIENQQATLLALQDRAPDILNIVNESDPTIVVIDGSRVFVLGTCVERNQWRTNFFNHESSEKPADLAKRCGLKLDKPERWYARELSLKSSSSDEVVDEESKEMPLGIRGARRVLRETLSKRGNMHFRDFAQSLKKFDVIQTTDGDGSHCSLKRCLNGRWLRAGSWYDMRKDSHLEIKCIFEILTNLKIPLTDYAESLAK